MNVNEIIIKLARDAGLGTSLTHNGGEPRVWIEGADWHDELTRFAALVRNAALEEAARVCKDLDDEALAKENRLACGAECAAAIADVAARWNVPFERAGSLSKESHND